MKRKGHLYQRIISLENLRIADQKARRGKRNQLGVRKHLTREEMNIQELHRSLANKEFRTSVYSRFTVFDGKEREISSLPYFPDRIVHHAVLNVLAPIFIQCFIAQTYSCIPGKGIHKCLSDVTKALKDKEGTAYCLKIDIRKFYPSINKGTLKLFLRRKFKDHDLLSLLDEIIDSNTQGIVIGNYLSQFFGNFYLTYFDHWLKEEKRVKYLFRYMDDIVILHHCKAELHSLREDITEYLENILDLELSNYQVFPVASRGVDFVGYKSYHTHILLRKSTKLRFKEMVVNNYNEKSIASYNGWIVHCNGVNLWKKHIK